MLPTPPPPAAVRRLRATPVQYTGLTASRRPGRANGPARRRPRTAAWPPALRAGGVTQSPQLSCPRPNSPPVRPPSSQVSGASHTHSTPNPQMPRKSNTYPPLSRRALVSPIVAPRPKDRLRAWVLFPSGTTNRPWQQSGSVDQLSGGRDQGHTVGSHGGRREGSRTVGHLRRVGHQTEEDKQD